MYGPLTYKAAFKNNDNSLLAVTWVPEEHQRRLRAYTVLSAYLTNQSRELLEGEAARKKRREYGDPWLLVETIVAAILGEETTITVDDAGAEAVPEGGTEPQPVNPDADALQEWFDRWEDDEHPMLAITEGETDAVGLGDCAWEVTWDSEKKRPRITVYDPGGYFPVLDTLEQSNDTFPTKLHMAWEFDRWVVNQAGVREPEKYVRRITWELVTLPDGATRQHPWNEEPTTVTCLKSDATWRHQDLGPRTSHDFSDKGAVYATLPDGTDVKNLDLDIDYIPVVHEPNTIARKEHFGLSSLAMVLQILDDIQAADTDLALASRTTGTPPLFSKTGTIQIADSTDPRDTGNKVTTYGPGQLFNGEVGIVDTSRALDALLKYIEFLLRRLSSNAQLPEAALGRVDPSKIDAGVIMALSFGPLSRMVKKMRMVRDEKHPLLFKMVARTALKYTDASGLKLSRPAEMPAVRLVLGRFMPLDRAAVIDMVTSLYGAKLISRLRAVQTLMEEAGLPIEDANEEVERIEHEDFEGAGLLADASDDINEARQYLGLEPLPEDQARPQPPPLNLPPAPGQPPQPEDENG